MFISLLFWFLIKLLVNLLLLNFWVKYFYDVLFIVVVIMMGLFLFLNSLRVFFRFFWERSLWILVAGYFFLIRKFLSESAFFLVFTNIRVRESGFAAVFRRFSKKERFFIFFIYIIFWVMFSFVLFIRLIVKKM